MKSPHPFTKRTIFRPLAMAAPALVVMLAVGGCGATPSPDRPGGQTSSPAPPSASRQEIPGAGLGAGPTTSGPPAIPTPTPMSPTSMAPTNPPVRADLADLAQDELDARLIQAAWENNVGEAGELISAGASVNARDSTLQSAHLIAASEGYLDLLNLTLEHGADIGVLDSYNGTGLIRAAERGHSDVVAALISAGTPLDHVNYPGYVALHEALIYAKADQVQAYRETTLVLVAAGANVSIPTGVGGETPRQLAAAGGLGSQESLIARASNEAVPAQDADRVLLAAAFDGDPDTLALALRAGANPDARDGAGMRAIDLARAGNHGYSERLLLRLGAGA